MCGLVKWRGVREVREWNLRSTNSQTPASLNFPRYFVAIAAFNNNCFSFRSAAQKLNGNRPQRRNQCNQSIKKKKRQAHQLTLSKPYPSIALLRITTPTSPPNTLLHPSYPPVISSRSLITPVGSSSCHLSLDKNDWVNISGIWCIATLGPEPEGRCLVGAEGGTRGRPWPWGLVWE